MQAAVYRTNGGGEGGRGGVKVCAHTLRGHVVMLHGTRSCGK